MHIVNSRATPRKTVLDLHIAHGILVPWPGTGPGAMAVKAPGANPWTAREFARKILNKMYN